jgi:hypothetical protein
MTHPSPQTETLTKILCAELFSALGFHKHGIASKVFSPLVRYPIHRFSVIASGFDQRVESDGFQAASKWIIPNFVEGTIVEGKESIPQKGPLLIASNHPGAYDALVIAANIPRDDLKIIVNIPPDFISELHHTKSHFLYASFDPHIRMKVVRSGIRHLENGGTLLVFASGGMDPDPASMSGAEKSLNEWSKSLGIFLRRVPNTQLLVSIISGILSPIYINHVMASFRKDQIDKQRISEFFQVMRQMLSPGILHQTPKVSFATPVLGEDLLFSGTNTSLMDEIILRAKFLLSQHSSKYIQPI